MGLVTGEGAFHLRVIASEQPRSAAVKSLTPLSLYAGVDQELGGHKRAIGFQKWLTSEHGVGMDLLSSGKNKNKTK